MRGTGFELRDYLPTVYLDVTLDLIKCLSLIPNLNFINNSLFETPCLSSVYQRVTVKQKVEKNIQTLVSLIIQKTGTLLTNLLCPIEYTIIRLRVGESL